MDRHNGDDHIVLNQGSLVTIATSSASTSTETDPEDQEDMYHELQEWPQRVVKALGPIIMLYIEKQQLGVPHTTVLRIISDGLLNYGYDYSNIAVANKWKSLVRAYKRSIEMQTRDASDNVNLARFVYLVQIEQLQRRLENFGRCFLTDEIMQEVH